MMQSDIKREEIDLPLIREASETVSETTISRKSYEEKPKVQGGEEPFTVKTESSLNNESESDVQDGKQQNSTSKNNACEICGRVFAQRSNLRRHMLVHSGEKPFTCEICNRTFTTGSNLKAHSVTHTEKDTRNRHACSSCHKSFLYKCSLIKHEKRRHSNLPQKESSGEEGETFKKFVKKDRVTKSIVVPQPSPLETVILQASIADVASGNIFNSELIEQFQAILSQMRLACVDIPNNMLFEGMTLGNLPVITNTSMVNSQ